MLALSVIILSAAVMTAIMLNTMLKPTFSARLTGFIMLACIIGGIVFYGCGYAEITGSVGLSVIRTPIAVLRMFVGVNDLDKISETTLVSHHAGLVAFWTIHLLAFCSTASAAMLTLGSALLRRLRLILSRRGELTLIRGVNDNSLAFARACREDGDRAIVFLTDYVDAGRANEIAGLGCLVLAWPGTVKACRSTLQTLRAAKRELNIFALDESGEKNLAFAQTLQTALEQEKIPPEKTRLCIPGSEEILSGLLQVSRERYGFGYVNAFSRAALSARLLVRLCPPWDLLRFSPDGRALEDFSCAVVGFGRHGQEALKQLVMNGQFVGSRFRAAIFSPNFASESGAMAVDCPELFRRYDIESFPHDGRSRAFYDYLLSNLDTLKLIVLCAGMDRVNSEIADDLTLFLRRHGAERIRVVRCGPDGVSTRRTIDAPIERHDIYRRESLVTEESDRRAILLNAVYDDSERSDWEKWVACDSLSKISSRASADFAPAFLKIAGADPDDVRAGTWRPEGALLENLGETEHLRWCAFHYAMGYAPMNRETFEERAVQWKRDLDAGRRDMPRPVKDARNLRHACLIPWAELKELSALEQRLTGRAVDYQQIDMNNVLALPKLLAAEKNP